MTGIAIVDAPDAETALALAIEQENVPPNERGRLLARRRIIWRRAAVRKSPSGRG